jgi:uncharacterized protein YbjT (DUF2867 family)/membrane protease YdiL (CAAX protease family)
MKVAVAGGTGFVGRHVVAALSAQGHHVVVLARGTHAPEAGPGVELVCCDVASEPPPLEALTGCAALVNLVGIKREDGSQTFERVHVAATKHLLAAAHAAGIPRFVHLGVVASRPDERNAYHDTKWQAEELLRASGLDWTILRPSVIYGRGDDFVTHLVKMVRFAPLFPVVGRGDSQLQPVAVETVATAVAQSLERDTTIGRSLDLVGPQAMTLREAVRAVAEGLGQSVWIVSTPVWLQRRAVQVMNALTPRPLSTPAQLQMLIDGLVGDPTPAREVLGVKSPPFSATRVSELAAGIRPLFGVSLRPGAGAQSASWLDAWREYAPRAAVLAALAVVLLWGLAALVPNIWLRMAAYYAVLGPLALGGVQGGWRSLLAPRPWHLIVGVGAAVAVYALGWVGFRVVLTAFPALAAEVPALYAWRDQLPNALVGLPLLVAIVAAEEVVWRAAVTLPLAARWGPWAGIALGALVFGVAHLGFGSALLVLAAVVCGACWGGLAVTTRSLVPSFVCHLLWDLAVLFWLPY